MSVPGDDNNASPVILDMDAIRERCNQATPGPWKSYVEGRDHDSGASFIMTSGADIELIGASLADQRFFLLHTPGRISRSCWRKSSD